MPRLSKKGAVRQMMTAYGQPQTVEAIVQYVEQNANGARIDWTEIKEMVDSGELAHVDGGANGKGGRLSLYGPGANLETIPTGGDVSDDDDDQADPAPTPPPGQPVPQPA